jgi:hypothetical protein
MQLSVTAGHVKALVRLLCRGLPCTVDASAIFAVNSGNHRVSGAISQRLCQLVPEWRVASRFLARYPLNPAAYSALGAVISHFLSLSIPPEWVKARAAKILKDRKRSFGLSGEERDSFNGVFTTDSTMGYRVGLHTTVSSCPDAFIYFSSVTHYSVEKIVRTATSWQGAGIMTQQHVLWKFPLIAMVEWYLKNLSSRSWKTGLAPELVGRLTK